MTVPISKRILNRVTITGADDDVAPEELANIYEQFPFVEFGILMSERAWPEGAPRFPSSDWLRRLYNMSVQEDVFIEIGGWMHVRKFPMSCHLCGKWVKDLLASGTWPNVGGYIPHMFLRYQLNTHGMQYRYCDGLLLKALNQPWFSGRQIIIQMDDVNDKIFESVKDRAISAPFFDVSHGAGVLPGSWPEKPEGRYCGYAGGLTPENLSNQMESIFQSVKKGPVWIDVETGVRTDNRFDINKVVDFLTVAQEWVIGGE